MYWPKPLLSLLLAVALIAPVLAVAGVGVAQTNSAVGGGFWSTRSTDIVDGSGNEVRIRGVNWFGFDGASAMPHGLWTRNLDSMVAQVADLGFNTIRLPFASELLNEGVTPNGLDVSANPEYAGLTSLELMDAVIDAAGEQGLRVILDRHALGFDNRHHLWYDDQFPESRLISDWQFLASRYAGNSTIIGADIYNEPHDEACWGCDDPARDWQQAATSAGNAIHSINPGWLIFVEGVEESDGRNCSGPGASLDCIWWGGNLTNAGADPVVLDQPNKVVYSPHEYATSVHPADWFFDAAFPNNLEPIWNNFWGYLEQDNIAPVMVGELGTLLEADVDGIWLDLLLAYLDDIGAGFTYWSLNPNSIDTGGILNDDWETVNEARYGFVEPYLLGPFDSASFEPPAPAPTTTTTEAPAPTTTTTEAPCLLYTSPSPRDQRGSRMPSSA